MKDKEEDEGAVVKMITENCSIEESVVVKNKTLKC